MRTFTLSLLIAGASPLMAQSLPSWAAPSAPAPSAAASQPPPGPPGTGSPAQVPLDGGLALLALAGGAYAARRLRAE